MRGKVSLVQYVIAALLIIALTLAVVLRAVDPLQSPEFKALELANMVAANVNALSTLKDKEGFVEITREEEFDVRVLFYDKKIFGVEGARKLYNYIIGDLTFDEEGYYVIVTPYRLDEQLDKKKAFIVNYPSQKEGGLEVFFERLTSICVQKEREESLAKVVAC